MLQNTCTTVLGDVIATFGDQNVDGFAGINGGTAAYGNNGIALFLAVNRGNIANHRGGGIRRYVVVNRNNLQPAFFAGGNHRIKQASSPNTLIGDNHRALGGQTGQFKRNVFQGGFTGNHFYRAEELVVFVGHYALTVSTNWVATFR